MAKQIKTEASLRCSFCGKTRDQVRKLIAGPTVYICDECVGLCNEIMAEEWQETKEEISSSKQEGKNDLSEFGVEPDTPDLFNNESESLDQNELLSSDKDDDQEDDLEIPAFLRRQKN